MTTQTTSAMTGAGADLRSALVTAAADHSDPDAAFRPMHGCLPQLPRRRPSTPSRGILSDRRRTFRSGQLRDVPRLPERRRAVAWGRRGCISRASTPALRSRVSFPEHGPAASSLLQGNCRPVDPRGSRPAPLSTAHARRLARTRSRASRPSCVVVERSTQARSTNSARVARLGPIL